MKDKYNLTLQQALYLAKKNIVEVIHSVSRLENVNTTFPQTKTIVDGMSVSGVTTDDIQTILNLKNAWQYILKLDTPFTLEVSNKINSFVAYNESLAWGVLRTGNVGIHLPSIPVEHDIQHVIGQILDDATTSNTYKALKYMYYAMRSQFYWDGNKRTALVSANYIMLLGGSGIININENQLEEWNRLLSEFYNTNDDTRIIQWTYDNCIYGIDYV